MTITLTALYNKRRRYNSKPLIDVQCNCGCSQSFQTRDYKSRYIQGHQGRIKKKNKKQKKWKIQVTKTNLSVE